MRSSVKGFLILIFILFSWFFMAGCNVDGPEDGDGETEMVEDDYEVGENADDHEESGDYTWDETAEVAIDLSALPSSGTGFSVTDSVVTITAAGTYRISGTLAYGRIIVNAGDDDLVRIILDDAVITCSDNAPVDIENAEKAIIIIDGTNILTDGSSYDLPDGDDEPNAALYCKTDLSIYGESGSLTVNGNYNDGIGCKDGLVLRSVVLTVDAGNADDGIRGKDYLVIHGGTITVDSKGDGLKSDNEEDGYGYISIDEEADITITTGGDGDAIQAETDVIIANGTFTITTGSGSTTLGDDDSAKGIKADVLVDIDGGTFTLDTLDDAIHSNESIFIDGGDFGIASGDDGIHADTRLYINGGTFDIDESYEGIESALITVNGGTLRITSSDDGVNVAGGNDSSSEGGFTAPDAGRYFYMNGGYIAVDAEGDGLDANGSIYMTGGTVFVSQHSSYEANGALDYDGTFVISGGSIAAAGDSQMVQAPSSDSTQYSVKISYGSTQAAGTYVYIKDEDGITILSFAPSKVYQSLVFSSPDLIKDSTYNIYSGSTLKKSFTVSQTVTSVNIN